MCTKTPEQIGLLYFFHLIEKRCARFTKYTLCTSSWFLMRSPVQWHIFRKCLTFQQQIVQSRVFFKNKNLQCKRNSKLFIFQYELFILNSLRWIPWKICAFFHEYLNQVEQKKKHTHTTIHRLQQQNTVTTSRTSAFHYGKSRWCNCHSLIYYVA